VNLDLIIISCLVTFAALTAALPGCIEIYRRYHRGHLVSCPETRRQASIDLSATLAAATSAFIPLQLRIKDCTMWPENRHCSRSCVKQLPPAD
jgi:hypothetical protein